MGGIRRCTKGSQDPLGRGTMIDLEQCAKAGRILEGTIH
jgi:hypothetical protein